MGGETDICIIIAPRVWIVFPGSRLLSTLVDLFVYVWKKELGNAEPFSKMRLNYLKFLGKYEKVDMGNERRKKEGGSGECKTMHGPWTKTENLNNR